MRLRKLIITDIVPLHPLLLHGRKQRGNLGRAIKCFELEGEEDMCAGARVGGGRGVAVGEFSDGAGVNYCVEGEEAEVARMALMRVRGVRVA